MNAHHWPLLSKTVLAYVKPHFSRWTSEDDKGDDADEGLIDSINVERDSTFTGTKSGQLLEEVFSLRTKAYDLTNSIKVQSIPTRVQRHNSYSPTSLVGAAKLRN